MAKWFRLWLFGNFHRSSGKLLPRYEEKPPRLFTKRLQQKTFLRNRRGDRVRRPLKRGGRQQCSHFETAHDSLGHPNRGVLADALRTLVFVDFSIIAGWLDRGEDDRKDTNSRDRSSPYDRAKPTFVVWSVGQVRGVLRGGWKPKLQRPSTADPGPSKVASTAVTVWTAS